MANPSKQKGTRAETKVVKYLNDHGFVARRLALAGSNDPGDIEAIAPDGTKFIIEVKTGKQTTAPNRKQIEEWCGQSVIEAKHSEGKPVLIIVRYHRLLEDADVYISWASYARTHMYFDEWVNEGWSG